MSIQLKGGNSLLWLGVLVISTIIVYFFFIKTGRLQQIIDQLFSGMTGTTPTTPGTTTPPPSGGSSSATGTNIYQVVSDLSGQGDVTLRGGGNSHRDNQGFPCDKCAREATWIFRPGTGGDWSVKLGSHGDEGGPEILIEFGQVDTDGGGGSWRCEGPHMDYSGVSGGSGSAPSIGGSAQVGIKGISWPTGGNTIHHEIWLDTTGSGSNWSKIATFDGGSSCGNQIQCPVPGSCQDTLRLDNVSGHEFISRSLFEIVPGQASTGGGGGGGITPATPPAATPPASGGGNDDDDDDDELDFTVTGSGNAGAQGTGGRGVTLRGSLARGFTYRAYQTRMRRKKTHTDMGIIHRKATRVGNLL